jgi:hypothetical protein
MANITFDVTLFRTQFPQFADETAFPDSTLQSFFDVATCYVSDCDSGRLNGDCRLRALNLMTAHLVVISDLAAAGKTPKFVTSSKVGSVSVSTQPPPNTNQWQWWLNLTPYGMQLLALLQASSIGGFYIGGLPEKAAFRKVGGVF